MDCDPTVVLPLFSVFGWIFVQYVYHMCVCVRVSLLLPSGFYAALALSRVFRTAVEPVNILYGQLFVLCVAAFRFVGFVGSVY